MAANVDHIVRSCTSYDRNNPKNLKYRHWRKMHHLPTSDLFAISGMDIVGIFLKTAQSSYYILASTGRYSELTRDIPASKTTAPHAAIVFMDLWSIFYSTLTFLVVNNGIQFASKCFAKVTR